MSAQRLRDAAKVLRERAEAATPGPWESTYISKGAVPDAHAIDRWFVMGCFNGDRRRRTGPASISEYESDATFIATMHPGVALALADLLELLVGFSSVGMHGLEDEFLRNATTVADLILGAE